MLVLRFKDKSPREWKVPGNLRLGGVEIPFGLGLIASALFSIAIVNLLTKQVATVSGVAMTAAFSALFFVSERMTLRRRQAARQGLEQSKDELRNADLRRRDVVSLALRRLERDLSSLGRDEVLLDALALAGEDRGPDGGGGHRPAPMLESGTRGTRP